MRKGPSAVPRSAPEIALAERLGVGDERGVERASNELMEGEGERLGRRAMVA